MNIEELLERYFEGRTSVEEEAMLKRFFLLGDIPENLMMYKPLFEYFEDEIKNNKKGLTSEMPEIYDEFKPVYSSKPAYISKKFTLWLSGAAACAVLLTGLFFSERQQQKCPGEGNYVMIDGQCYTDTKMIRSAALNTLREISVDDGNFSEDNEESKHIIENQLKEFGSLFDE